ncbi:(Fe-S)-binding protein [Candidatus Atribacteria bacterium RBG_19FT_COMBO_35_14]|uniref:(Fe-S)-binding protein n=1 Tax=Candidatus Sediminicultor quintus TaxID=1797291 RepID=A0A1F5AG09_9BACT|nr:MAG: (Fe-S)-binding protein [Candidatus Atribacteria bacterium RBG_19FT_COMBO_35_14]OGD36169.1 MAG: (Fe-S)-binding protein [Candidatus Atribacteria bacterium RBG_16_35_8]
MSHMVGKSAYKNLEERLNKFPQGAPPSETLYKILSILFNEKEAELVSRLPIKPFSIKTASRIWKLDAVNTEKLLDELAGRAILLDSEHNGIKKYVLPPPMAGFFEFSMMRTRHDLDQKLLSELFYQYLNVEEDFVKDLFLGSETLLGRTFVQEEVLSKDNLVSILDYEKASHIIKTASSIGISMCYCRHKREHLGKACDAPMDICMTFNNVAKSLIRHNYARRVEASECMELLHKAYEYNLVQCGENVKNKVSFICNCCGCCCEFLVTAKKFGMLHPVQTTSYIPKIDEEKCTECGKCVKVCPISAIEWISNDDGINSKPKKIKINEEICLGCGVCVRACSNKTITLERREEQIITPVNSVHRIVLMAIEKGKLQELIFNNQAFGSHRVMAAVLAVILKLPLIKQMMASKQMKSIYLEKLFERI